MFHPIIPWGGRSNLYGLRLSQSSNLRIADNSAVDRDNRLFADHAIVVSKPSIRYAERSWRAFRLLVWRRCRRCARRLSAEPLRLVTGQNSGLGSAALVCLVADPDFA
jgi:hypothetical protein